MPRNTPSQRQTQELDVAIAEPSESEVPEALAALSGVSSQPAAGHNPIAQDPELLSDFILESREHLANIESYILTLEKDASNSEALNAAFRGFHTIKGLAGFLELWEIQKLAHEVETLLDGARNAELTIDSDGIDVILKSADVLTRWMAYLESRRQGHTQDSPPRNEELLLALDHLTTTSRTGGHFVPEPAAEAEAPAAETPAVDAPVADTPAAEASRTDAAPRVAPARAATQSDVPPSPRKSETFSVKVDTAKLDYLVDMAGEMVIAESLVRHDPDLETIKNARLQRHIAQLARITAELQKTAMAMRLVPVAPLFRRMERLVRDLSRQLGKPVEMATEGGEIELDRTIVEELADPLMHMVRNAMDHGVEPVADRVRGGKPPTARLLLKAQHQAGFVVIEISDDGRGLDRNRIAAKAVERGIISPGHNLTDHEVYNLIFEPGFSTAAAVTNVSGRGVGMDVVRKHVEKLRGRIEIKSTPGVGSSFFLKLPLTLAIIDGLVVGVGQERYVVPIFPVREIFRPSAETIWTVQQKEEMALVRGSLMPVIRLHRRFNVTPKSEDATQGALIVAEIGSGRFGLLVDELIGKQEVVIKSLGEVFGAVTGIAGGAILGDGRVGLILDMEGVFRGGTSDAAN